jgi:hypothetical protein
MKFIIRINPGDGGSIFLCNDGNDYHIPQDADLLVIAMGTSNLIPII